MLSRLLLILSLAWPTLALAATFNISAGQYPDCSTSWNVSGNTYTCVNNGTVELDDGDDIIANAPSTIQANNGFELGDGTVGSDSNPISLVSTYGDIELNGTTVYGDITASSGDLTFEEATVVGDVSTNGDIILRDSTITGDVFGQNGIDAQDTDIDGTVTANGSVDLEGGSVTGQVTSQSNSIQSEGTDLLGGAQAQSGISIEGGTLSGDFVMTSNNPIQLDDVVMTDGSISGASTVTIEDSTVGSSSDPVAIESNSGPIEISNGSTVYGDLTAPNYSEIDVSSDSSVYGTCTPSSPGCTPPPPDNCSLDSGLSGEYYDNTSLSGTPEFEQIDPNINYTWGNGSPESTELGNNTFSIRWTGYVQAPSSGNHQFRTLSDDGVRLYVDGTLLIDNWTNHGETYNYGSINLTGGEYYSITLEYYENTGNATIEFDWNTPDLGDYQTVPSNRLFHCTSSLPIPQLEWRMDETQWDGSSGEVIDESGNSRDGSAQNQTTTETGFLCRAGEFDGSDDYLTQSDIGSLLAGTASMSFWIKTSQSGSDTAWQAPGVSGVEVAGSVNDIFWGWIDANGRIGVSVGNDSSTKSNLSINDNTFHHIVLTRDATGGTYKIYIDGTLDASGSITAGSIGTNFTSIGRIEDTGGSPEYFQGTLDELLIFDQVLTDNQVTQIHDLQSNGQNLDGSDRDLSNCLATQLCYSDDFNGSLSSDWQTLNSSGSFGNPRVVGGRLRLTDDTNNVATAATLLRQFPSAGNRVEVEFDFYAYKDNDGTNAADGVTITFSDGDISPYPGSYGGSLGYAQRDNGDSGFNGGWLGIGLDEYGNYSNNSEGREGGPGFRPNAVAIRGSGSGTSGYQYLDGTEANLSPTVLTESSTPHRYRIVIDHSDGVQAMTSVERDTGSGFQTLISPFDVLAGGFGQSAIPDRLVLTLTGSTGGSSANHEIDNLDVMCNTVEPYDVPIDHFELVRGQDTGLTCEPMDIAIRACGNAECSVEYSGEFDITMSPVNGWVNGPTFTRLESGDTVQFLGTDPAVNYELGVDSSTPSAAPLTQDLCFIGASSTAEPDCFVTFDNIGLRFFPSDNSTSSTAYFDMIAGLDESGFSVQAVETNTTTGVCEPLFADNMTLDFDGGTTCTDPGTCSSGPQVSLTNGGNTTAMPNPQNPIGGANTVTIPLEFGAQSTADFALNAPDVGIQPLELTFELPDADGNPSGTEISQTVNLRVRPAELRLVNIQGSNGTMNSNDDAGDIQSSNDHFGRAGETFTLEVQSLNAQGNPTPNFGRTATLPTLDWTHTLVSPTGAGSVSGNFTTTSDATQWEVDGDGTEPTSRIRFVTDAGLAFSEVGIIDLLGTIPSYLPIPGSPDHPIDTDTRLIGRFTPAYFAADYISGTGTVQNAHSGFSYQGQELSWASPLQVRLTAYNTDGDVTNNYDSDYWTYNPSTDVPSTTAPTAALTKGTGTQGGDLLVTTAVPSVIDDGTPYNGIRLLQLGGNTFEFDRAIDPADLDATDDPFVFQLNASLSSEYLTDDDGVCFDIAQDGCDAWTKADINTQASIYYGRVRLESAQGPEASNLELPLFFEFWDSTQSGFVPMTDEDSGTNTNLIANDFGIDGSSPATLATQTSVDNVNYTEGVGFLTLSAPGDGNTGEVDVSLKQFDPLQNTGVADHLWFDWNEDGNATPTSAKGYFGLYQGREPILYQLEGFR